MGEGNQEVATPVVEEALTEQEKIDINAAMQEGFKDLKPGLRERLNKWANESVFSMQTIRRANAGGGALKQAIGGTDMIGPWVEIVSVGLAKATGGLSEENERGLK